VRAVYNLDVRRPNDAYNKKYYVYTLLSLRDYDFYTDFVANDLWTRIREHSRGMVSSTKMRIPFKLVHYEYFTNLEDAKARTTYLKSNVGRAQLKETLRLTLRDRRSFPYRLRG